MLLRVVTLTLAQAFDLATFLVMVGRRGLAAEANPLVANMFNTLGMPAVGLAKVALVTLIAALVVAATVRGGGGRWAVIGGLPLAMAITAGLVGGITNAAAYLGRG